MTGKVEYYKMDPKIVDFLKLHMKIDKKIYNVWWYWNFTVIKTPILIDDVDINRTIVSNKILRILSVSR